MVLSLNVQVSQLGKSKQRDMYYWHFLEAHLSSKLNHSNYQRWKNVTQEAYYIVWQRQESLKILEIFISWHFEKAKTKRQPKLSSKFSLERRNVMRQAVLAS